METLMPRTTTPNAQSDAASPWPQVGRVDGELTGTGFVIAPSQVLTAGHVVGEAERVQFVIGEMPCQTDVRFDPQVDAALLQLPSADLPPPMIVCDIPSLPADFGSWGYRNAGGDGPELLRAWGRIVARPRENLLQLECRGMIRPGMSGAPIAIQTTAGWAVVGMAYARYRAEHFADGEDLAFAIPICAISTELSKHRLINASTVRPERPEFAAMREFEKRAVRASEYWSIAFQISTGLSLLTSVGAIAGLVSGAVALAFVSVCVVCLLNVVHTRAAATESGALSSFLAVVYPWSGDGEDNTSDNVQSM